MTSEAAFLAMDRTGRLACLRQEGHHLGLRVHGGHVVHLYAMHHFHVELFLRRGTTWADAIEVLRDPERLEQYVPGDALDGLDAPLGLRDGSK